MGAGPAIAASVAGGIVKAEGAARDNERNAQRKADLDALEAQIMGPLNALRAQIIPGLAVGGDIREALAGQADASAILNARRALEATRARGTRTSQGAQLASNPAAEALARIANRSAAGRQSNAALGRIGLEQMGYPDAFGAQPGGVNAWTGVGLGLQGLSGALASRPTTEPQSRVNTYGGNPSQTDENAADFIGPRRAY